MAQDNIFSKIFEEEEVSEKGHTAMVTWHDKTITRRVARIDILPAIVHRYLRLLARRVIARSGGRLERKLVVRERRRK